MVILKLIVGLVLLVVGAEALVRGASKLALAAGVTPLVVGLTVVAFGTSAPELAVTLSGALSGASGVSSGNVIGSNIFNVLVILGLAAVIIPLSVHRDVIRIQVPLLIAASALMFFFAWDGTFSQVEGFVLAALSVGYVTFTVWQSRRDAAAAEEPVDLGIEASPTEDGARPPWVEGGLNLVFIAVGLVMLIFGAGWLVDGAVVIAKNLGMSDFVIGVTIVAAGTSLPEVATSVLAGLRGERDIAVGNVIGSNIFNILVVLGFSSSLTKVGIPVDPAALTLDLPIMLGATLVLLPIMFTEREVSRAEGALLIMGYVGYATYLIATA